MIHIHMPMYPSLEILEKLTLCVRFVSLALAIMGVMRFGPCLWAIAYKLLHRKSTITDKDVRRAAWAIVCVSSIPFSVNFFGRVFEWSMNPTATKAFSLMGITGYTVAMAIGLIGSAIEDSGKALKVTPSTIVLTYLGFMFVMGLFGLFLLSL